MTPIEIRPKRFTHLLVIPPILLLMGVAAYVLYDKGGAADTEAIIYIVCASMLLVGAFLIVKSIGAFRRNPLLLRISNEGIESAEGGMNTGLIRWEEIREARLLAIPDTWGNRPRRVLGLYLRNPEQFRARRGAAVQAFLTLHKDLNGGDDETPSVMLTPSTLGKRFPDVLRLIESRIQVAAGARPRSSSPIPSGDSSDDSLLKDLYQVGAGRKKPGLRYFGFAAAGIACAVYDFNTTGPRVRMLPLFFIAFALYLAYEVYRRRPRS